MAELLADMGTTAPLHAIGLMSGTSLDGIDAALLVTDGERIVTHGPALTLPYPEAFRQRLRALLGCEPAPSWQGVVDELTDRHAEIVQQLLSAAGMLSTAIDVIGFHGQTVWHRPEQGRTLQIGDGGRLAVRLGITVVDQFRTADVAAGGQGAPLVPLYHAALAAPLAKPLAVVNVGGVANISWIGEADAAPGLLAFDTGPGNALIDDWVRSRTGSACDEGGRLAATGHADGARVARWLSHPFFQLPWPKSLDRDAFGSVMDDLQGASTADGAATLALFTARTIAASLPLLPAAPRRWIVCGGGRHNPVLMQRIAEAVGAPVAPAEAAGWRGDMIEAEAFAFLAVRALRGLSLTVPSTTGVPQPLTGGQVHRPAERGRSPR